MTPRKLDVLEREYQTRRIPLTSYAAGRLFQSVLVNAETPEQMGAAQRDQERVRNARIVSRQWAQEHREFVTRQLGAETYALLHSVLIDGHSYAEGLSEWRAREKGKAFREALDSLCWAYASEEAKNLLSRK